MAAVAVINWKVAAGLVSLLVVMALLGFAFALADQSEAAKDAEPAQDTAKPTKNIEPVHVRDGWLYPDGETVDDDTHLRRLLADQIVLTDELRDPAWKAAL